MSRKIFITVVLWAAFLLPGKVFGESAEEYFQKGHQFYLQSKPTEAEEEFRQALRIDPQIPDAYYYLGSIYFKQERYAEAIEECQEALKINPQDIKSLLILGLSWQQLGMYDQAIKAFLQAEEIDKKSAAVHSALGLVYCAKGDFQKAEDEYHILKNLDSGLASDLLSRIKESKIDKIGASNNR